MHRDVIRPVLHYFTRDGLEGLQLLSKLLRDLINNASMTLPLRYIKRVIVVECRLEARFHEHGYIEGAQERVDESDDEDQDDDDEEDEDDEEEENGTYTLNIRTDADREDLQRRLHNTYVNHLEVCFGCSTFLRFLRQQSAAPRCQVGTLEAGCYKDRPATIDYDAVRFALATFAPRIYASRPLVDEAPPYQYTLLVDHASMRDDISHVSYELWEHWNLPVELARPLVNVSKLHKCDIFTMESPARFIDHFVVAFKEADAGGKAVGVLNIIWDFDACEEDEPPSSELVNPTREDVTTPDIPYVNDYISRNYADDPVKKSTSRLFVFKNASLRKRLSVYTFTVEAVLTRTLKRSLQRPTTRVHRYECTHFVVADA